MQKQLDIGNKKIIVGDKCVITEKGYRNGFGPMNVVFTVWGFKKSDEMLIGLQSPIRNKEWADLDGKLPLGHGLWITPTNLIDNMLLLSTKYKISDFLFKNRDLDSMGCSILHKCSDGNVFVEVDENIEGGSCDGLGKEGHCILLPRNRLKIIDQGEQKLWQKKKKGGKA